VTSRRFRRGPGGERRAAKIEYRALGALERELFGDIVKRKRWDYLPDFAQTTYKDDGAAPMDLLYDARAYLQGRAAEDGFAQESKQAPWPTMGDTRPGSHERN
jgi:hypothetical protein